MMLRLSLRELRLIVERLVQAAGTPPGLLFAVRDAALASAILPVAGLEGLGAQIARLEGQVPHPPELRDEGAGLRLDAGGQHAWLVAEAILDLAVAELRRGRRDGLRVGGLAEPHELRVLEVLAEKHGLDARIEEDGPDLLLHLTPRDADALTRLDRLRHEGLAAEAALWWPLYHASHEALAPDSFESRRHAGAVRVEADGRVVGRNDEDETDLTMLAADPTLLRPDPILAR